MCRDISEPLVKIIIIYLQNLTMNLPLGGSCDKSVNWTMTFCWLYDDPGPAFQPIAEAQIVFTYLILP